VGLLQAYKMAIKSIRSNKVRSFLTMLGVIIGVMSVITAVAFAEGTTKQITDQLSSLGTNLINVYITGRGSNRQVTYEQLKEFGDKNSEVISAIAPEMSINSATTKYGTNVRDTRIIGTTSDYEKTKVRGAQSGRYLMEIDNDNRQRVAVIGTAVVNDIFDGNNPIGESIKIDGNVFKVVGVLAEIADGSDSSDDDQIVIPVSVAQRMSQNSQINNYAILATDSESVDAAMIVLEEFLTKIYGDSNSFRLMNAAQMLDTLGSVTGTLMLLLGGIAGISLVVGGIGIMNIMLVSVTERTREIGIRKAIGAKKRNILTQFLIEALMVTGIGGTIGLMLGCGVIFSIGRMGIVPSVYSFKWMTLSFGISLLVGVIFGIFPANKAANLNPIQALRHE